MRKIVLSVTLTAALLLAFSLSAHAAIGDYNGAEGRAIGTISVYSGATYLGSFSANGASLAAPAGALTLEANTTAAVQRIDLNGVPGANGFFTFDLSGPSTLTFNAYGAGAEELLESWTVELMPTAAVDPTEPTVPTEPTEPTEPAAQPPLQLTVGSLSAQVGEQTVTLEAAPFYYEYAGLSYTMVPLRFIGEQGLGATINWKPASKTAVVLLSQQKLPLTIGVANPSSGLTCPPVSRAGRTFVPLRYVAERLGCQVQYNGAKAPLRITAK